MHKLLLNRDIYTDFVQTEIPAAGRFLWLVTADLKDLHVETDNGFEPFLALLAHLVEKGVAVRLMHAKEPGPRFREDFDNYESLISANMTGAGIGAKSEHRRNFEAGFVFDDTQHINQLMNWIDNLYLGEHCHDCQRREYCPDPIVDRL